MPSALTITAPGVELESGSRRSRRRRAAHVNVAELLDDRVAVTGAQHDDVRPRRVRLPAGFVVDRSPHASHHGATKTKSWRGRVPSTSSRTQLGTGAVGRRELRRWPWRELVDVPVTWPCRPRPRAPRRAAESSRTDEAARRRWKRARRRGGRAP